MSIRELSAVVAHFARCPAGGLFDAVRQRLESNARCPVANYLLGCHWFDRGRAAAAVRRLMIAHHAEPALESAALLVFAGLSWAGQRGRALLPTLLDTWEEFRRPEFDRTRQERRLLDAFAQPVAELNGASALARRLWRLPIRTLRSQLRAAVLSPAAGGYPLLAAPA